MDGKVLGGIITIALFIAIPYALALWLKRIGNKGRMPVGQVPFAGIGGLLLLLIMWMIVISPVISFGALVVDFEKEEATYPELQHFASWVTFKAYTWASWVVVSSVTIYGGWLLLKRADMGAVKKAKWTLWIALLVSKAALIMIPVIVFGQYQYHQKDFSGILGALFWTIAWTIYLSVSRRVKATYGGARLQASSERSMERHNGHFQRVEQSIGYENASDRTVRPHIAESSQDTGGTHEQSSWMERLISVLGLLGIIAIWIFPLAFGVFLIGTGYMGLDLQWGVGWAIAGMFCAFILRTTLPLMIGSYIYVTKVWDWEWYFALLFIFPGLLFVVPMMMGGVISWLRERYSR